METSHQINGKKFTSSSTAMQVLEGVDLSGRTMLITGCTAGIGVETARALALHGAHVVMANRSVEASEALRERIRGEGGEKCGPIDVIQLDLGSLASVKKAAVEFLARGWPLHVLILNAGVWGAPSPSSTDGYESTYAVNHLGHFYLTQLLMPKLRSSGPGSRLVIVSSNLHARTGICASLGIDKKLESLIPSVPNTHPGVFRAFRLYSYSKLCNVLTSFAAHRREHGGGVNTYVLHPGVIPSSSLGRSLPRGLGGLHRLFSMLPFAKNLEQGAATTAYCAASPHTADDSGKYYVDCRSAESGLHTQLARDEALQDALWERSVEQVRKFEAGEL